MGATRTFTFLGTGTSVGVPMVACPCEVCRSSDPRNHRYRCSVFVRTPEGNILIDTTPELRLQLLRERIDRVNAVLFTHYHVDHLYGLDDLRPFPKFMGSPVPLYCTAEVEVKIREIFAYAFTAEAESFGAGAVPKLEFRRINEDPFVACGQWVTPVPLIHNVFDVFGFRI